MSVQNTNPATAPSEARFPWRALFIGLGIALALAVIAILSQGSSSPVAPRGASMLILAPAAFLAGVFSFLSPCTLPILPAYFAFTFQAQRERIVIMTVAFFLGLATTMVLLGATATALSQLLFRNLETLTFIGGLIIIAFGILSMLGKGFSGIQILSRPSASIAGSYLYGATFALGWTACVGPILGALLTLLATQGIAILQGAVLSFIYALGLGTPLIIVATFFSRLGAGSPFWKALRGRGFSLSIGGYQLHLHTTSLISGALLVIMGLLLATGQLTALSEWAQRTPLAQWALSLEQWVQRLFFGQ
ncbi:MAG: cytochrome c biogenesis CcdA family protein [Roseiflexaceae bacterium]|nr:cytochrome c biogenesis CcdA family protein [Roseiflexus sp.]MDW8213839.1 cytochrome c biogenesis CcdA family protein [Roseiflexaceae bacterium]